MQRDQDHRTRIIKRHARAYWSKVDGECQIDQDHRARIVKKLYMLAYLSKAEQECPMDQDQRTKICKECFASVPFKCYRERPMHQDHRT